MIGTTYLAVALPTGVKADGGAGGGGGRSGEWEADHWLGLRGGGRGVGGDVT